MKATTTLVSNFTTLKLVNHQRKQIPGNIIEEMKVVYGVDIDYMKPWRAKKCAIEMTRGGPADGYRKMPIYIYMLNTVYFNSHIRMHKSTENEFMYLFIALYLLMRGFPFYRLVVIVDTARLSGSYKGIFILGNTLDDAGMSTHMSQINFFEKLKILKFECDVSDSHYC